MHTKEFGAINTTLPPDNYIHLFPTKFFANHYALEDINYVTLTFKHEV